MNDTYIQPVCNGHIYLENSYLDATDSFSQAAKAGAQQCGGPDPGEMFPTGNVLVGGATFGATSPVEDVFDPTATYSYTPDIADTTMRDDIINNAGYKNIPFPGD